MTESKGMYICKGFETNCSSKRALPQMMFKSSHFGTALAVQWLRLHAFTKGDVGSIPGGGTKIPHVVRPKGKKKFAFHCAYPVLNIFIILNLKQFDGRTIISHCFYLNFFNY